MSVKFNKKRKCWYVDTHWPDGTRTRARMPDEAAAGRINKKIEVACVDEDRIWQALRQSLRLEHAHVGLFRDFADLYLESYVKVQNRSLRSKSSRLDILKRFFGPKPFDSLRPRDVAGFVVERKKHGAGNRTVNRDVAVLKHVYTWAVEQEFIAFNPFLKLRKLEEVEWVGRRPTDEAVDAVFAELGETMVPLFTFIRDTGCRREEALSLRLEQIDFAACEVVFQNTKNGKSRRVPMTEDGLWAVQAMPGLSAHTFVFYRPDTLKRWTGDGVALSWERARAAAGYSWLRIHDLRHAYGIKLAEEGCPMHYISEVLGHYSVDFTRKIYARFSPESASRAVLRVLQGRKSRLSADRGENRRGYGTTG